MHALYCDTLCGVQSTEVDYKLRILRDRLMNEARLQRELLLLQGSLEPLLTAATWG